jgi:hypothetical protein
LGPRSMTVRTGMADYCMGADGSRQVNRTRHPGVDIQPDWQPHG